MREECQAEPRKLGWGDCEGPRRPPGQGGFHHRRGGVPRGAYGSVHCALDICLSARGRETLITGQEPPRVGASERGQGDSLLR